MNQKTILCFIFLVFFAATNAQTKVIHALVALCDNNQNIAKVPAKLGNGKDLKNNLYWGAKYGLKTHFINSKNWQLVKSDKNINAQILERAIFKHKIKDCYLVADAYNGDYIYQTIEDAIDFAAGLNVQYTNVENQKICIAGGANLIVYIGHNGMMDFEFPSIDFPAQMHYEPKDAMVLACYSNKFFTQVFYKSETNFVLGTNSLLAPEAYVLENALKAWLENSTKNAIENAAATAYAEYQKISLSSAKRIFLTE